MATFTGTAASGATTTLTNLRVISESGQIDLTNSNITDTVLDHAIYEALRAANRVTYISKTTGTLTLSEDGTSIDPTGITGWSDFMVQDLIGLRASASSTATLYKPQMQPVTKDYLMSTLNGGETGDPTMYWIETRSKIWTAPIADDDYTIELHATVAPPTWTYGTASAASVTFSWPYEILHLACFYLAPAILNYSDPAERVASPAWITGISELTRLADRGGTMPIVRYRDI